MSPLLPTLVIGGYLGAGKTTLVNHLLRHANRRRIAVMVNDFGDLSIDADLIVSQDGNVLTLAGGCVCCSVGSDLMNALIDLGERVPVPDLVLIETSGVALPGAVARSARLAPGIGIEAVVVMADAQTVRSRAQDPYVGDTVLAQLREADLLVLNKLDLVDAQALPALQAWLAEQSPSARVLLAHDAQVPAELVLGFGEQPAPQATATQRMPLAGAARIGRIGPAATASADTVFASVTHALPAAVNAAALASALTEIEPGLLRFKGVMHDAQRGPVTVQGVGTRVRIEAAGAGALGALEKSGSGQLVVIGLAHALNREAIAYAVASASVDVS